MTLWATFFAVTYAVLAWIGPGILDKLGRRAGPVPPARPLATAMCVSALWP